jgi:hypothetical protein
VRACQRPARYDAVALADLLVDDEAQVGEQRQIERDRLPRTGQPVVLGRVDVIDELRVVHVADAFQLAARADVLEGPARGFGLAHRTRIADHARRG